MRDGRRRNSGIFGAGVAVLLGATIATAAMQIASTTIPVPSDEKPVLLSGLEYPGAGWTVGFTAVRLEPDPKHDGDKVQPIWTMIASSSRPMVQKVIIEIHLLDGSDKKLKSVKNFVVVKANVERQEFPIKMKIKDEDWQRAEKAHIKVTFTVL